MPFFQNVFDQEFRGNWLLSDQQYNVTFKIPANVNGGEYSVAWRVEPYDFSVTTDAFLTMRYNPEPQLVKEYHVLDVDLTGLTTAAQVVSALNSNTTFAQFFEATVKTFTEGKTVQIRSIRVKQKMRFFFENVGAEEALRFNLHAGINEIPEYFERHTIANASLFGDSVSMLVELNPATAAELAIIREFLNDPTWVAGDLKADWELLAGRSGLFLFKKYTYDGSMRLTDLLEYHAGSVEGDTAKLIQYQYTGANTVPDVVTEIPHVLVTADLVTPP